MSELFTRPEYLIVWAVTGVMCVYLFFFFGKRVKQIKKDNARIQAQVREEREKCSHLTEEVFDSLEEDAIVRSVIYHILAKEERMYENPDFDGNIVPYLSHGEKMVYTMYQVENSMEGGRGSIHSFFITDPFCLCKDYYEEAFSIFEAYDIVKLLKEAEKLAILIENDQEDEIDEDSDYATYNFTDFTNEILANLRSSNISEKIAEYIKENKNEFIEK